MYFLHSGGHVIEAIESVKLDDKLHAEAHHYVLLHSDHINSYSGQVLLCVDKKIT